MKYSKATELIAMKLVLKTRPIQLQFHYEAWAYNTKMSVLLQLCLIVLAN